MDVRPRITKKLITNSMLKAIDGKLIGRKHVTGQQRLQIELPEPMSISKECQFCYIQFPDLQGCREHQETHTGSRPYICIICGMTFRQDRTLRGHMKSHLTTNESVMETYPCGVCGDDLYSETGIREHVMRLHTAEWPVACNLCTARFTTTIYLTYHRNSFHIDGKNIICSICSKQFTGRKDQIEHIKETKHFGEKPYKCSKCQVEYSRNADLELHILKKHSDKSDDHDDIHSLIRNVYVKEEFHLTDDELEVETRMKDTVPIKEEIIENDESTEPFMKIVNVSDIKKETIEMDLLVKEESEQYGYIIPIDRDKLTRDFDLNLKIKRESVKSSCKKEELIATETTEPIITLEDEVKPSKTKPKNKPDENINHCNLCGMRFEHFTEYGKHLKWHGIEARKETYKCDICDKNLYSRGRLIEHMRRHSNDQRHPCDQCNRRFLTTRGLGYHLKLVHKISRRPMRYKCNYCDKTFSRNLTAREHENIHTGQKPYLCNRCGMRFVCANFYRKHLKNHTGMKLLYHCDICGKVLRSKKSLIEHMHIHSNKLRISCDQCDSRFKSPFNLRYHKRSFHGVNEGKVIRKPFTHFCLLCDRKYRSILALNFHMKKHIENQNYTCAVCGNGFKDEEQLKCHRDTVHSIRE